uniref:C2H2-type domain-containing protein n=1 Tax=Heliothis virescens TaxID=7102 RepID=A0A2A4JRQ0_HELVI
MYGRASGLPQEPEVATLKSVNPDARSPSRSGRGEGEWTCPDCGRSFKTKIALGVHKRRAHPMAANAEAAPPQVIKRRWAEEEVELLARTEARLAGVGSSAMNMELMKELPSLGRSLEAIKGYRRKESHKSRVQSVPGRSGSDSSGVTGGSKFANTGTPTTGATEGTTLERPSERVRSASADVPVSVILQSPITL